MDFLQPTTWSEALTMRAERPDAAADRGRHRRDGRDQLRPPSARYPAGPEPHRRAAGVGRRDGRLVAARRRRPLHAGHRATSARSCPVWRWPSHTVASPQIRNRGTVGGNLGSASPAGDAHPALLAAGAEVEVESAARGTRLIPIDEFYTGVKRNALEPDELIAAVLIKKAAGPQQFSKVGTRNAMVIAVCAFAWRCTPTGTVGTGIGSAAPTPLRAPRGRGVPDRRARGGRALGVQRRAARGAGPAFGELVAAAASPIDDVRGTAAYRRHALAVMARRTVTWAWNDLPEGGLSDARHHHGQRHRAGSRRRLGGREPALRAARAHGPARLEERLRAGRVRLLHGPPGRRAGLLLPGRRRPGEGREVVTVEGLADGERLHPIQQAFIDAGAVQCGFCTPGLLVAAHDLLERMPTPSDPDIREALSGNLCRCTGYEKILDAVRLAARGRRGMTGR